MIRAADIPADPNPAACGGEPHRERWGLGDQAAEVARRLLDERMIPVNDVARMLRGPDGRQPSKVSLWRWVTKGIRVDGIRVRLETAKIGGTRYTSLEAVERFSAALEGSRGTESQPRAAVPHRTDSQRRRAVRAAKRELKGAGWME